MKHLRKSILLATALLVSTNLMADSDEYKDKGERYYKEYKYHNYKKYDDDDYKKYHHGYKDHDKYERRSHRGDVTRFFIGAVYNLKLTKDQETKIDKAIQEFKEKKFSKFNGFTKDGFDKQAYIDARTKSKEDKIKLSADLIEKIYTILDKKQIEQLNKEFDRFKQMKMERGMNGKGCYDRR